MSQSPLDLIGAQIEHDKCLKPTCFCFSYTKGDLATVQITPNGFSCKVGGQSSSILKGDHLKPNTYLFKELHAHWGENSSCGSEHLLNGNAYSAEMHLVCWNMNCSSVEECFKRADGIAVIGLLMKETDEDNPNLVPLMKDITQALNSKDAVAISKDFDPSKLLPAKLDFYTYCGSLTTPGYHECVMWTVLNEPVPIGTSQLKILRSITPKNFREPQQLNNRKIRCTFDCSKCT